MTDREIRVGVVGLGYWGPNLVRNLQEVPGAEVAYVCDAREDRLQKIARRYPAVRPTQRYADYAPGVIDDHSPTIGARCKCRWVDPGINRHR